MPLPRPLYQCRIAVVLIIASVHSAHAEEIKESDDWRENIKLQVYKGILPEDEKGFVRLEPPKAGDWRSIHTENPQTFEAYRLAARVRPTAKRTRIVLQPLGKVSDEFKKVLEALKDYAEIFFQTDARIADPIELELPQKEDAEKKLELDRPLPMGHRHGEYERQYNGDVIMDEILAPKLPNDAVVYLGITMADIWSRDLHYVFGLGSLDRRVGVYSLARYYPEFWGQPRVEGADVIALRRACKVLNHETGHMFGLTHCLFYGCTMNGSNSLEETDRNPVHECPVCHRKLLWNIGFDGVKRYEALRSFYKKHGLKPEAEWMEKRIRNWKYVAAKEKREDE